MENVLLYMSSFFMLFFSCAVIFFCLRFFFWIYMEYWRRESLARHNTHMYLAREMRGLYFQLILISWLSCNQSVHIEKEIFKMIFWFCMVLYTRYVGKRFFTKTE